MTSSKRSASFQFRLRGLFFLVSGAAVFLALNRTLVVTRGSDALLRVYVTIGVMLTALVIAAVFTTVVAALTFALVELASWMIRKCRPR